LLRLPFGSAITPARLRLNPIWAIVILFAIGLTLGGLGWFAKPVAITH